MKLSSTRPFLRLPPALLLAGFLMLGMTAFSKKQPAQSPLRPHVLVTLADDRSLHAGAFGAKVVFTPAIDRLAPEGVLLGNACCTAPSYSPSRALMLRGYKHNHREPVSLANMASSILEATPVATPKEMTENKATNHYQALFAEREPHANIRKNNHGYPARAIRTAQYLYIQNPAAGRPLPLRGIELLLAIVCSLFDL